ncbi:N-6 DNA methylase, partial [Brachyspira sp.]|uniref:N-6 DNA methylase n=1 Tax=Brachyspira sp. TaxID=1977261 RepID=UPI0026321B67
RFWAGVPNIPKKNNSKMAIYTCFIQHVINSLKETGKGAIVVPTGFITASSGIERKILEYIVDNKIVYGCVSMPSNVFANTGTNVSILFFDKSSTAEKVVLIDASNLGEDYKDSSNKQRRIIKDEDIEKIITTFYSGNDVKEFSVNKTYDEIKANNYSLSAGQYFDIEIEYVDITEDEFKEKMENYTNILNTLNKEKDNLNSIIINNLRELQYEK